MKTTNFQVFFTDDTNMYVRAMNPFQAYIKACNERINQAKNCNVKMVFDDDHMIPYEVNILIKTM